MKEREKKDGWRNEGGKRWDNREVDEKAKECVIKLLVLKCSNETCHCL